MPIFPRPRPVAPTPIPAEPAGADLVLEVPIADFDACISLAGRRGDQVLADALLDLRNSARRLRRAVT